MAKNKYTENGTVFHNPEARAWIVQLDYHSVSGGAPFKTVKWATWNNSHYPLGYQETNEGPDMIGWKIMSPAEIVLYADSEIVEKILKIQQMVQLGYKGYHRTSKDLIDELIWKMSQ